MPNLTRALAHLLPAAALALGLAAALAPATAQVPIRSATVDGPAFLRGEPGRETWLAGELRLPPRAGAKVPAVVLVHGSGGISGSDPGS